MMTKKIFLPLAMCIGLLMGCAAQQENQVKKQESAKAEETMKKNEKLRDDERIKNDAIKN